MGRDTAIPPASGRRRHFNPRAPHGARPELHIKPKLGSLFQSTRPAWGATVKPKAAAPPMGISIHAPRMGRDARTAYRASCRLYFNPRAPHGARLPRRAPASASVHFNPRAPHGARLAPCIAQLLPVVISIHAPRMGRDGSGAGSGLSSADFNPRAPHGARRPTALFAVGLLTFQSTRPAWGATPTATAVTMSPAGFQSTRPAWGATGAQQLERRRLAISIHAPRMGRDMWDSWWSEGDEDISIHAPRMGRDIAAHTPRMEAIYFNPRAPHGARRICVITPYSSCIFQSTRPAWGATPEIPTGRIYSGDFNPRAPHGARQVGLNAHGHAAGFQSTRPAWGAT